MGNGNQNGAPAKKQPDTAVEHATKFAQAYGSVVEERDQLLAEKTQMQEQLNRNNIELEALRGLVTMLEDRIKLHGAEAENNIQTYRSECDAAKARTVKLETILANVISISQGALPLVREISDESNTAGES